MPFLYEGVTCILIPAFMSQNENTTDYVVQFVDNTYSQIYFFMVIAENQGYIYIN